MRRATSRITKLSKDALEGLSGYFGFYNENRPYQSLDYRTPKEVHFQRDIEDCAVGVDLLKKELSTY
jgi:hypothetical protein